MDKWTVDDIISRGKIVVLLRHIEAHGLSGGAFADAILEMMVDHLNEYHPHHKWSWWTLKGEFDMSERDEFKVGADDLEKQLTKIMSDYQDLEDLQQTTAFRLKCTEIALDEAKSEVQAAHDNWMNAADRAEEAECDSDMWEEKYLDAANALHETRAELDDAKRSLVELKPATAVSRADVEKALRESTNNVFADHSYPFMTDAMCNLFAIEAELAADPVEELAQELHSAYHGAARARLLWEHLDDEVKANFCRMARHLIERGETNE